MRGETIKIIAEVHYMGIHFGDMNLLKWLIATLGNPLGKKVKTVVRYTVEIIIFKMKDKPPTY